MSTFYVKHKDIILGPYGTEEDAEDAREFLGSMDWTWDRLVEMDGDILLEHRDPNDGLGWDPSRKCRYQYMVVGLDVLTRRLPPTSMGDTWEDIGLPSWEEVRPIILVRWGLLRDFLRIMTRLP